MKKILNLILALTIGFGIFSIPAYAEDAMVSDIMDQAGTEASGDSNNPSIFRPKNPDNIVQEGDLIKNTLPQVIKFIIGILGAGAFASFMYSGIMMVIFGDHEDEVSKYKKNLIYSVIGLGIAGLSFLVVTNIVEMIKPT